MVARNGGAHASEGMPCSSFSQAKKLLNTHVAGWSLGAHSGSRIMMITPPNTSAMAENTANCWMRFAGTELTNPAASRQTASHIYITLWAWMCSFILYRKCHILHPI